MKRFLLLLVIACAWKMTVCQTTPDKAAFKYNISTPTKKWKLPAELDEISGVTWLDNDHLLAIEDIHPCLYSIKLVNDKAEIEKRIVFKKRKTDKKFDVEDVTLVGNTVYALWSHGKIFKIDAWNSNLVVKEITTFL